MESQSFIDPNYVPDEYKVPYDIIELPSQGLLYKNKKSKVKVEYLTAYDENVLTSPNLLNSGKVLDVLIERKVKDLGFDVYFVSSSEQRENFANSEFDYYTESGCYGINKQSYSGTWENIKKDSGLLVIFPDNLKPWTTKVTVNLNENN